MTDSSQRRSAVGCGDAAQRKAEAAIADIARIDSAIGEVEQTLAGIQGAIVSLQQELIAFEPPGCSPDALPWPASEMDFNAAMVEYLRAIARLQQALTTEQRKLAHSETTLLHLERDLNLAETTLDKAQGDLDRQLRSHGEEQRRARQRYETRQQRLSGVQEMALKNQAAARKALQELQAALYELLQINTMAAKLDSSVRSGPQLMRQITQWQPDDTAPLPFAVLPWLDHRRLENACRMMEGRQTAAVTNLNYVEDFLPRLEDGQLQPPLLSISIGDCLELQLPPVPFDIYEEDPLDTSRLLR